MDNITTLIGTLGFPIVMCLLMYRQQLKLTDVITDMQVKMTEVINDLKIAIVTLTERLDQND